MMAANRGLLAKQERHVAGKAAISTLALDDNWRCDLLRSACGCSAGIIWRRSATKRASSSQDASALWRRVASQRVDAHEIVGNPAGTEAVRAGEPAADGQSQLSADGTKKRAEAPKAALCRSVTVAARRVGARWRP